MEGGVGDTDVPVDANVEIDVTYTLISPEGFNFYFCTLYVIHTV